MPIKFKSKAKIAAVLQICLIIYAIVLGIAIFFKNWGIAGVAFILAGLSLYIIKQNKKILQEDVDAYFMFFGGLEAIFLGASILVLQNIRTTSIEFNVTVLFSTIIVLIVFLIIFFKKYQRNYTVGKIIVNGKKYSTVYIDYDLVNQIKKGNYTVKGSGHREGDIVKIELKRHYLYNKPYKIIE